MSTHVRNGNHVLTHCRYLLGLGPSGSYLKKDRVWGKRTMEQYGQGRGQAGHASLVHYEGGNPIRLSCLTSLFWRKWLWKRTRRTSHKSSVQNKTSQLCSKCHHKPPSVNIKLLPQKKISLPGSWHKIELLNGWLSRLRLGRFMYPTALQSLWLDLAHCCFRSCKKHSPVQPLTGH